MPKLAIDVDWEVVDSIVVIQLRETWEALKSNLGNGDWVFVWGDQEADDIEIQRHIDALDVVLSWYATSEQLKEIGITDDQR